MPCVMALQLSLEVVQVNKSFSDSFRLDLCPAIALVPANIGDEMMWARPEPSSSYSSPYLLMCWYSAL